MGSDEENENHAENEEQSGCRRSEETPTVSALRFNISLSEPLIVR